MLTDVSLPDGNGIGLTAQITAQWPDIPVIEVPQYTVSSYLERALALKGTQQGAAAGREI